MSLKTKPVKSFKKNKLYKHRKWRDIAIMAEKIYPSDDFIKIEGYIYNINVCKLSECPPINLGYDDTFTITNYEVDQWVEVIDDGI